MDSSSVHPRRASGYSCSFFSKGCLTVVVILVIITLQVSPVLPASLNKQQPTDDSNVFCRTNAICGWRVLQSFNNPSIYYTVKTICQCRKEIEACTKAEDDVSLPAYVFRCRKRPTNPPPPTTETSDGS